MFLTPFGGVEMRLNCYQPRAGLATLSGSVSEPMGHPTEIHATNFEYPALATTNFWPPNPIQRQ